MPKSSFPRSFPEFARRFSDEDACFDYIVESRWPDGSTHSVPWDGGGWNGNYELESAGAILGAC